MKPLNLLIASLAVAASAHAQELPRQKSAPVPLYVGFTGSSPSAEDIVLDTIKRATKTIDLAAYQLTSTPVLDALNAADKRGVAIRVLMDKTQAKGVAIDALKFTKAQCHIDRAHKIMHHKFIIADRNDVQMGSFNFSKSAATVNAENALLVRDVPTLAAQYTQEFEKQFNNNSTTPCF